MNTRRAIPSCPTCLEDIVSARTRCFRCGQIYHTTCLRSAGCVEKRCQTPAPAAADPASTAKLPEQNGFYLISAFLMLLGCFLVMQEAAGKGAELATALELQSLMALYLLIIAGLSAWVFRGLGLATDGLNLACITLVLGLDPTFFTARFQGFDTTTGLVVGACNLLVMGVTLALLMRAGFELPRRTVGNLVASGATIFLLTSPLTVFDAAGAGQVYEALWLVPLVLAFTALPCQGPFPHPYAMYFDTLGRWAPSMAILGHLLEQGTILDLSPGAGHAGVALLTLAVLHHRQWPGALLAEPVRPHLAAAALIGLFAGGSRGTMLPGGFLDLATVGLIFVTGSAAAAHRATGKMSFAIEAAIALILGLDRGLGALATSIPALAAARQATIDALAAGLRTVGWVAGEILGGLFAAVSFVLEKVFLVLGTVLKEVFSLVGMIFSSIGPALSAILDPILRLAGTILGGIFEVLGHVLGAFATVLEAVVTFLGSIIAGLVSALGSVIPDSGPGLPSAGKTSILLGLASLGGGVAMSHARSKRS